MKPLVKGLLIGCLVLVVIASIALIAAVRWLGANKDRLRAQADEVRTEGRVFGRSATTSACVAKTFDTYRSDTSFVTEARARVWLIGCLETSTPEPAFCAQVPPTAEIMRTVNWRLGECSRLGLDGDKGCTRILTEVQKFCEDRARR
ncbi:MAG: hypothetical protein ACXW5U_12950 [Thermoanaerobaculia bacterium]